MPIYEYRCTNGHVFETMERFSDDPLTECEVCGAAASRVLYPVAIHFKGSGFYSTDYGKRKAKSTADSTGDGSSGDTAGSGTSDAGSKTSEKSEKSSGTGSSEPAKKAS